MIHRDPFDDLTSPSNSKSLNDIEALLRQVRPASPKLDFEEILLEAEKPPRVHPSSQRPARRVWLPSLVGSWGVGAAMGAAWMAATITPERTEESHLIVAAPTVFAETVAAEPEKPIPKVAEPPVYQMESPARWEIESRYLASLDNGRVLRVFPVPADLLITQQNRLNATIGVGAIETDGTVSSHSSPDKAQDAILDSSDLGESGISSSMSRPMTQMELRRKLINEADGLFL